MGEPKNNISPVTIEIVGLSEIVEAAVEKALAKAPPKKRLFTTKETAAILNIDESWLSAKARAKQIPHRMFGHYRYFSEADIEEIIACYYVPMVHIGHDGQKLQADSQKARTQPIKTREG